MSLHCLIQSSSLTVELIHGNIGGRKLFDQLFRVTGSW